MSQRESEVVPGQQARITVIVLSYERQEYLRRQLLCFAGRPIHLIFADGSAQHWPHGESGWIGQLSWEYFHCPGYNTYLERLARACERVKTEYVCLLDDQECILWTGLQSAMETLDNNPEHSCAGGLVSIAFDRKGQTVLAPWGHRGERRVIADPSPLSRFRTITGPDHLSANLYYQVIRSADMKLFAAGMRGHVGTSVATYELALAGFLALKGEWAMGDYPYWIRNGSTVPPPPGFIVVMPQNEIDLLCQLLIRIVGQQGMRPEMGIEARSLALAVEAGWGESSQWGKDSVAFLKGVRADGNHSSPLRKLRTTAARKLRQYFPSVYRIVRPNSPFASQSAEEFVCYGLRNSDSFYLAVQELLTISAIWRHFPSGIPAHNWPETNLSYGPEE